MCLLLFQLSYKLSFVLSVVVGFRGFKHVDWRKSFFKFLLGHRLLFFLIRLSANYLLSATQRLSAFVHAARRELIS